MNATTLLRRRSLWSLVAAVFLTACADPGVDDTTATADDELVAATNVRVASFNVTNVTLDTTAGDQRPWSRRRAGVIADILGESADVVGLQEVSVSRQFADRLVDGETQMMDLVNGLNRAGGSYALTNAQPYNCATAYTTYNCVHQYRGSGHTTRIIYNTRRIELVRQGAVRFTAQDMYPSIASERYLAYAVLRVKATGTSFFFSSVHLSSGDETIRASQWRQLIAETNRLKGTLPVISVGDFNATRNAALAEEMLPAMRAAGYGDILNQEYQVSPTVGSRPVRMVNTWINSFNHFNRNVADYSYEDRRELVGHAIDYIFATNSLAVPSYKVVIDYDPATLQVTGTIPADHNMLRATVTLP